jgi:uncharacterized integral membrane protein
MIISLVLGILLGAFAVIFALQNPEVVTVRFFDMNFEGSMAIILIATVSMGVLASLLLVLPESIKNYFSYRSLKKENTSLKEDLRKQKELNVFAKTTPATPEEIAKLDQGRIATL